MVERAAAKRRQRQGVIVVLTLFLLLGLLFLLGKPTILGFVIFSQSIFVPVNATSETGANQISPNGGTVDLSDNTVVTLTFGSNSFVTVSAWDKNVSNSSIVTGVTLFCEIDGVRGRGEVLQFGYNIGTGWNYSCNQNLTTTGLYSCNLYSVGIDTPAKVNALNARCLVNDSNAGAAAAFDLDFIKMHVNASVEENKTTESATVSFHIATNLILTVTDNSINLGVLGINDNVSSESVKDWFNVSNDGSLDFDLFAYGVASPFTTTTNNANLLPNNFYFVHANYSASGTANTTYVPVPANFSTKVLLVDALKKDDGLDTAAVGIRVVVPADESPGSKSANLILYVEPN